MGLFLRDCLTVVGRSVVGGGSWVSGSWVSGSWVGGSWVLSRGCLVVRPRSPYEINTSCIHSFYLVQTAVSYQLSLNFHNTSKFVALTKKKKKTKKIRQRCHPRGYPNFIRHNNGAQWLKTKNSRNRN